MTPATTGDSSSGSWLRMALSRRWSSSSGRPELLVEKPTAGPVNLEGLGLPPRSGRARASADRAVARGAGVLADEPFQLRNELRVPSGSRSALDALLERRQPLLFEPGAFRARERLVELGQRWPTPQAECLPEQVGGLIRRGVSGTIPASSKRSRSSVPSGTRIR